MKTPVLLLLFNRPELTRRVFGRIRQARPARLYLAADGPRQGRPQDPDLCAQARTVAGEVDWPCEVRTLYRDANLGCRHAVRGALDWFFGQEEQGIVLEDDCLADPSWFPFAEAMLERHAGDERVICVSASHFHGRAHQPAESYFYSIYNHCWGWASWRRGWRLYDDAMADWARLRETDWLRELGGGSRAFQRYWTAIFDAIEHGRVDSWAYYWTYSAWVNGRLSVLPGKNLVVNLGFGDEATHTGGLDHLAGGAVLESMGFPLRHPAQVAADQAADRWTARNHFGISARAGLRSRLLSVPGARQALRAARALFRGGPGRA